MQENRPKESVLKKLSLSSLFKQFIHDDTSSVPAEELELASAARPDDERSPLLETPGVNLTAPQAIDHRDLSLRLTDFRASSVLHAISEFDESESTHGFKPVEQTAARANLNNIPVEVITSILMFASYYTSHNPCRNASSGPFSVTLKARSAVFYSHISHRLRHIALTLPFLWDYLHESMPVAQVEAYSARSGERGLTIQIDGLFNVYNEQGHLDRLRECEVRRSVAAISRSSARWQRLFIFGATSKLGFFARLPLPNVKALPRLQQVVVDMVGLESGHFAFPINLAKYQTPNLVSFSGSDVLPVHLAHQGMKNLKSLSLSQTLFLTRVPEDESNLGHNRMLNGIHSLICTLGTFLQLKHLALDFKIDDNFWRGCPDGTTECPLSPVHLPSLESFELTMAENHPYAHFIDKFEMPQLRNLKLNMPDDWLMSKMLSHFAVNYGRQLEWLEAHFRNTPDCDNDVEASSLPTLTVDLGYIFDRVTSLRTLVVSHALSIAGPELSAGYDDSIILDVPKGLQKVKFLAVSTGADTLSTLLGAIYARGDWDSFKSFELAECRIQGLEESGAIEAMELRGRGKLKIST